MNKTAKRVLFNPQYEVLARSLKKQASRGLYKKQPCLDPVPLRRSPTTENIALPIVA
jgi:hypothetical protein